MGNDLSNKEEAIDQVKLLPHGDFLQAHRKLMVRSIKKIQPQWNQHIKGLLKPCLVLHDFNNHLFEKVSRTARPSVLLISIGFEGTRQLVLHLKELTFEEPRKRAGDNRKRLGKIRLSTEQI